MIHELNNEEKWHSRYLQLARYVSTWSKDPTKIGAVAVGRYGQVLSQGYNGFPRGVIDAPSRMKDKPTKYLYTVHAEMNMICNANLNSVSLEGSYVYVIGIPPCCDCAKCLIQVKVDTVVLDRPHDNLHEPWKTSWDLSQNMFSEAGVKVHIIEQWIF